MSPFKSLKLFIVSKPQLKQPIKKMKYALISFLSYLLGPALASEPKVLGYHTVGPDQDDLSITPQQFEAQLDWLQKNRFHVITLRQWWDILQSGHRPAPRTVILTFDDGFRGTYTHAAPILAKRGLGATVFIITDYVGRHNSYDRFLDTPELPMMSWDEIFELKKLGWDIQSHSHRHYPHYKLPAELRQEELSLSKEILEQRLGDPVDFFCFPYGAFDTDAAEAVAQAGYQAAVTCREGHLPENLADERYLLKRTLIYGHMPLGIFASTFTTGYYRLLRIWAQLKKLIKGFQKPETPFDELHRLKLEGAAQ